VDARAKEELRRRERHVACGAEERTNLRYPHPDEHVAFAVLARAGLEEPPQDPRVAVVAGAAERLPDLAERHGARRAPVHA